MDNLSGLGAVLAVTKSRAELARRLGLSREAVTKWRAVPFGRVFDVERLTGIDAEIILPEEVNQIRVVRQKRLLERARARFGLSTGLGAAKATIKSADDPHPRAVDLFDLGLTVAAIKFAAGIRGYSYMMVLSGHDREVASARAYGMALAHVVGRVSAATIADVVGTSRQNVANAAERYLRARDGDDPEIIKGGRVIERGRKRRPKNADDSLWRCERQFLEWLEGQYEFSAG